MKGRRFFLINLILFLVVLFSGCKTIKADEQNVVYVMIYDYENKALKDVSVFLDNHLIGKTDINGRFIFKLDDVKEHKLELKKNEYETIIDSIIYQKQLVLYYKAGNINQLLNMAEKKLDSREYDKSLEYIKRAESINSEREDVIYFKSLVFFYKKDYKNAENVLLGIDKTKENEKYINELLNAIKEKQ